MSLTANGLSGSVLCNERTQERRSVGRVAGRGFDPGAAGTAPAAAGAGAGSGGLCGRVAGRAVPPLRQAGLPVRGRDPHGPYVYLSVGTAAGRRGLIYVPATLAGLVAEKVAVSASVQQLLGEISGLNLELLARRELE